MVEPEPLGATAAEPRTISMWVKPTSLPLEPGASGLISKYRHFDVGQSNYYAALYQRADGRIVTRLTGNGTNVVEAEVGALNEWQHYTFVIAAGPNASAIYRNGRRVASGTLNLNDVLTTEPLRIGNIVGDDDQLFRGSLDQVRIYARPLTSSEIPMARRRATSVRAADVTVRRCGQVNSGGVAPEFHHGSVLTVRRSIASTADRASPSWSRSHGSDPKRSGQPA